MKIICYSFVATLVLILCAAIIFGLICAIAWLLPYAFYVLVETDNTILQIGAWFCFLWFGIAILMKINDLNKDINLFQKDEQQS